jgi:hypothetical protein
MKSKRSILYPVCIMAAAMSVAVSAVSCSVPRVIEEALPSHEASETLTEETAEATEAGTAAASSGDEETGTVSDLFSARDLDPSYNDVTARITLEGSSISVEGKGAEVNGSAVTVNAEGVYLISGSLSDGQIIVDADKAKVQLVLDNADITCRSGPAILGNDSDKIFLTLAEDSINSLSGGTADSDTPACVYTSDSLTVNGSGSLEVKSEANGIQSKDDIVITGGIVNVDAAKDGIKGKDYVAAAGGTVNISAGQDGIKSTNDTDEGMGFVYIEDGAFSITSVNDGIQASSELTVKNGTIDIVSGGGSDNSVKEHTDGFGGGFGRGRSGGSQNGGMTPPDWWEDFDPSMFEKMTPPEGWGEFDPSMFEKMTPPEGWEEFARSQFEKMTPPEGWDDFDPSQYEKKTPPEDWEDSDPSQSDGSGRSQDTDGRPGATEKSSSSGSSMSALSALDFSGSRNADSDEAAEETATAEEPVSDSAKGLKAGSAIRISGGTFNIDSADDAVHSDGDADITGGVFTLRAGDDAIHSEATVNIGEKAEDRFDTVQIFIETCYEGIEGVTINQNSGSVYIITSDDGFNAAGGDTENSSGNTSARGGMMSASTGTLNINGGLAVVNSASGDHDAFDSNGDINLNGGYVFANGQEPLDSGDFGGSINYNGASVITMTAGTGDLTQRYSFVDNDGNVIVSFVAANGTAGRNCTDCKAYTGGTVTGGSRVLTQTDAYYIITGGKLTGGQEITAKAAEGGMAGGGRMGGRGGQDFQPPTDENGEVQMPEDGFGRGRRNSQQTEEPAI